MTATATATATVALARGTKYSCTSCAIRFYDLNRLPATCPRCKEKIPVAVKATRRPRRKASDNTGHEKDVLSRPITAPAKAKSRHARWR